MGITFSSFCIKYLFIKVLMVKHIKDMKISQNGKGRIFNWLLKIIVVTC